MALTEPDAELIVGILTAAAAVIGPFQWRNRRRARRRLADDTQELLRSKDEVITADREQISYLRAELVKRDDTINRKDAELLRLRRRSGNDQS